MTTQSNSLALTDPLNVEGPANLPSAIADRSPMASGRGIAIETLPEAVEFAKLMCQSEQAVPAAFRRKPGLCLAVTMQALRWGFDPFGVAQNAYVVNDKVAYEAKLIKAALDQNAPLAEPLDFQYEGQGDTRVCRVVGVITTASGGTVERVYETPPFKSITPKNSPLWKTDPDQQLAYFAARAWARRHCPGVLLGVFDRDEMLDQGSTINAAPRASLRDRFRDAPTIESRADAEPDAPADEAKPAEDTDTDETAEGPEGESPDDKPEAQDGGSEASPSRPQADSPSTPDDEPNPSAQRFYAETLAAISKAKDAAAAQAVLDQAGNTPLWFEITDDQVAGLKRAVAAREG